MTKVQRSTTTPVLLFDIFTDKSEVENSAEKYLDVNEKMRAVADSA